MRNVLLTSCLALALAIPGLSHAVSDVEVQVGESIRLGTDVLGLNGKLIANTGEGIVYCFVHDTFGAPTNPLVFSFNILPHHSVTYQGRHISAKVRIDCGAGEDTMVSWQDVKRMGSVR